MQIRIATPDDEAAVTAILAASYPTLMPSRYDRSVLEAALPLMTRANPKLLSSGSYFIAVAEDGAAAGCGGWTRERPGTGERNEDLGHIRHFATHPDYTGRGVGRAIFTACQAQARSAGIGQFECYASLNAEGFYRSLGFETIEHIDVEMGPGLVFRSVRMACTI